MMISFSKSWLNKGVFVLSLSLGLLIAACAPPTKPVDLERAEAAVEQVQTDPNVTQYVPVRLDEAKEALQRAQVAWEKDESTEEVEHLAYLAQRRAAIAEVAAAEKAAQAEIKNLGQERQQMLMEVRELEARQAREQAKMAEARTRELEQRLAELDAEKTKRGYVLTLGDILFEVDRAELTPGGMQNLFRLVTFLKEYPDREVVIEGHTDSTGSAVYNQELSQRRADSVYKFLMNNGISPERIVARGYGEAYPVAPNDTAAGRQRNRRVEIVILGAGERAKEYQRPG
ncbi:OmpA/MotB domain protein [Nitrosococcus halophilus Nc 4]|uniref:OmpA/MotB domain protein n=1 Tax=Nitrosococcus halophilus (strain Nc4) TaxID=472759 RepID=D5BXU7_NITHN|nr:OmpA family protein [Nitrosococcus halophilus]ADE15858.1 OmpA/MotB domain protein [Nitrosococcus halophilus Nc 4]